MSRQICRFIIVLLVALSGCSPQLETQNAAVEVSATSTIQAAPTPTTPTLSVEPAIQTLVVWIPERLSRVDDENAAALLDAQIREFEAAQANVQVELRRKRSQEAGGILATLRSASLVAPGALPDITLLPRRDLIVAGQNTLIQPLEGLIASGVISGVSENALDLGLLNDDQLYGLAYVLDALLVAYNGDAPTNWTFDGFLRSRLTFAFPAGDTTGVNSVFLLQYFSAGGTPPVDGSMTVNEDALLTTLRFYEQAVESGLVDARIVDYMRYEDYQTQLIDESVDAGVVDVTTFSDLWQSGYEPNAASIPSATTRPVTFLKGWMWVLVSADADQQQLAAQFINWMMNPERQGEYAQAIGLLPSQADARRLYLPDGLESALVEDLVSNAMIPPEESASNTAMRAMQTALVAVLNGELSAEEATRQAIQQLSG